MTSINTVQQVSVKSAVPGDIYDFLDEYHPGVTDRVGFEDVRAIVEASTVLALETSMADFIKRHMVKVWKAWDEE